MNRGWLKRMVALLVGVFWGEKISRSLDGRGEGNLQISI